MSGALLEGLRQDVSIKKKSELKSLASQRSLTLLALRAIHNTVEQNKTLESLINLTFDLPNLTDNEVKFLEAHDLSGGRTFDSTTQLTLRTLSPPRDDNASISISKPNSVPAESSQLGDTAPAPAVSAPVAVEASNSDATASVAAQSLADHVRTTLPTPDQVPAASLVPSLPDGPSQQPPQTEQVLDLRASPYPAKAVHLPPVKAQQEDHLRQRDADEGRRRSEEAKLAQRLVAPQTELASSPSSTVGAHSAATPQPPQDSPDTSPDSDSGHEDVLPPKDLQLSAEQRREKEEHDRLLEAQKDVARKGALGDVSTPDEQLRWEEREAAAREAEEREARENAAGPEPGTKPGRDPTEAGQVAEAIEKDQARRPSQDIKTGSIPPDEKLPIPREAPIDDESIAVAPRTRPQLTLETSDQGPSDAQATPLALARPSQPASRVFSETVHQNSISGKLTLDQHRAEAASQSVLMKKELLSPSVGAISPLMQRRMPEKEQPSSQAQIQHLARPSSSRQVSDVDSALSQLDVLKGAADDPDKDYLEPLFRIQAHESPSSRSRSLPELIRNSAKVISTEDQFTANHERLAFRMLRRIYQLQNANKWSLRQMEKQKEPEQPFTHHDHMMEEMKWMRRDFKAERKLKVRVCAWLARSCAEWCNASLEERAQLQVKIKPPRLDGGDEEHHESVPELEHCGDSAPEDDAVPGTPRASSPLPRTIVVPPELLDTVEELQRNGSLSKTLSALPRTGILTVAKKHEPQPYTAVSKFVEGKVLPTICQPSRKRSRYDYEDEEEVLASEPGSKRLRDEQHLPAEGLDCALFHPDNKPIRDRLHSNNAFRPPSEFLMPSTPFYEFRNGSQWIWEDDQKLRKLAKEYSFNWSLISDEMALSTRYKSSAERRTPWECFERWVELESLPADMRKTMYFKTWFSRLEQSQQAAERRYQAQVQAIQQQAAQSGGQTHIPMRRRTTPSRVEKRRSTRYLWMVEGFRKLAKKREQTAWKQAETARAAAQRKSQNDNSNQVRQVKMTPQEFSKKRHERDLQIAEAQRQHRAKLIEAQQRQIALARVAAHQQQTGTLPAPQHPQLGQQRPLAANMPAQQAQMQASGQQMPNVNAPMASQQQQQARGPLQMATRNGHLAPPQMNGQVIPQAQMQARAAQMAQHQQKMQTGAQQMRNPQSYAGQQQYGMASGHLISPGGGLTNSQQLQNNQALLAAFQQQQQQQQQHHHQQQQQQQQQQQGVNNQPQAMTQSNGTHAMNGSPSMPPPPTPQNAPQQLSSGHIPQIVAIKSQLRGTNPQMTDDQLNNLASQQLKNQSQSSNQARQNAMNAAAGIPSQSHAGMSPSTYAYSHTAYQNNRQLGNNPNGANGMYPANGDGATQQSQAQPQPQQQQQPQQPPPPPPPPQQQQQQQPAPNMSPVANNASPTSESQAAYRQKMWKMQQMQMQSPNAGPATLNGSPGVAHASPNMMPASPSMQYANMQMNQMGQMNQIPGMNGAQRPPSRSNTPQTRVGSSGSGVAMGSGIQSPGGMGQAQGSPRNMTASVTR